MLIAMYELEDSIVLATDSQMNVIKDRNVMD